MQPPMELPSAPPLHSIGVIKIRKINIYESPILTAKHGNTAVHCVLDSGATASLISLRKAKQLKLMISPTSHRAIQVDGISDLKILGEVHTHFTRGDLKLFFNALVVNKLGTDILGGTNFLKDNDIYSRMAKDTIVIKGSNTFQSTPATILEMDMNSSSAQLVRVQKTQTILSGEHIQCELPPHLPPVGIYFAEPKQGNLFSTPSVVQASNNFVYLPNDKPYPVNVKKNEQVAQIRLSLLNEDADRQCVNPKKDYFSKFQENLPLTSVNEIKSVPAIISEINFNNIPSSHKKEFEQIVYSYSAVFQQDLPGYNGFYGPVHASIQFGSKARPPPHKTRTPAYGSHGQKLFNQKALAMMQKGVLIDPYKLGIQPSLVLDSWVVKKPAFASLPWDKCEDQHVRLVTGFDPLNKFLKQIPPKASNPMTLYTSIASWTYMGECDFTDMYWQIKLRMDTNQDKQQLKHLCIRTACGTLAYARAPMGLLGMDAIQEELTDKLLGDLVVKGSVAKVADNVYFGSDTLNGFLDVFHNIVSRCHQADLRLKPSKIKLNIKHADILGLHWNKGTLTPTPHKLDPLAHCERPRTVKGLRSFLGAVRFHDICLPSKELSSATANLDLQIPSQRSGKEEITWDSDLITSFNAIQQILKTPETVFVPRKNDSLFICGDGAPTANALGTKLFIKRPGIPNLLPSFNYGFRIKANMKDWSPCEFEAYSIAQGIKKMKPFFRFVETQTTAMIDSKACVQAVQRMENGKFSSSRRLQDLLSNLSAERVKVVHMSAKISSPLLQLVDFGSRNPVDCDNTNCTICNESTTPDVTFFGQANVTNDSPDYPLTGSSLNVWKEMQRSSPNLKRAAAMLESGKLPHKKEKSISDVRSYLRFCTLNKDGLVVAKATDKILPFQPNKPPRIVIPREFAHSYITILHRKFEHPSFYQMLKLFNQQFFTLDAVPVIKRVTESCEYPCQAMKTIPKESLSYSTNTKPATAGSHLNADVLVDFGQKILVVRDNLTSFTDAKFIKDESKLTLRDALLILSSKLRNNVQATNIRVDSHSSFKSLKNDDALQTENITLDLGSPKNVNKNAVAEKSINELRTELLKISPQGGPFSERTLAKAIFNLNNRIRHTGRSARELWVKRDSNSNASLIFEDCEISDLQYQMRVSGHDSSSRYNSRNGPPVMSPEIKTGDRVYIKSDKSKHKARDQFIVMSPPGENNEVSVQKLSDGFSRKNVIPVQTQNLYPVSPRPSPVLTQMTADSDTTSSSECEEDTVAPTFEHVETGIPTDVEEVPAVAVAPTLEHAKTGVPADVEKVPAVANEMLPPVHYQQPPDSSSKTVQSAKPQRVIRPPARFIEEPTPPHKPRKRRKVRKVPRTELDRPRIQTSSPLSLIKDVGNCVSEEGDVVDED